MWHQVTLDELVAREQCQLEPRLEVCPAQDEQFVCHRLRKGCFRKEQLFIQNVVQSEASAGTGIWAVSSVIGLTGDSFGYSASRAGSPCEQQAAGPAQNPRVIQVLVLAEHPLEQHHALEFADKMRRDFDFLDRSVGVCR